jgi:RHS repeat-associated protein
MAFSRTTCTALVVLGLPTLILHPLPLSAQSDAEVISKRVFAEPLVSAGGSESTAEDNRALAAVLAAHAQRQKIDDFSLVEQFLASRPKSPWQVSLLTNLGVSYYKAGYFTKAMAAWEQAWSLGKAETNPQVYDVANRALGELAKMNARVGRADRVEALLQESKGRAIRGNVTELLTAAAEGLWLMKNRPEEAFRCGPLAVARLYSLDHPGGTTVSLIQNAKSTKVGTSLVQARDLAASLGLHYQMAKRTPGAEIIVPSVVNWKAGHFAALLKKNANDRYLVQDVTFGEDFWITAAALDSEGTGYFLVPAGDLPEGWQPVSDEEGGNVFGKGATTDTDPDPCTPCDQQNGGDVGGCAGCAEGTPSVGGIAMARYTAHTSLISLHFVDTPFFYTPPRGPGISFTLCYNQRDPNPDTTLDYSNFGPKWSFDWLSFVVDDSSNLGADVKVYQRGGGFRTHAGYDPATQSYRPELYSQATLVITSTNPIVYEKRATDGSKEIFDVSNGTIGTGRKVFLHQIVDPTGNTLTLSYDGQGRISGVTDAVGRATTLGYSGTGTRIMMITTGTTGDPAYRSASFDYDPTSGFLMKITDMAGITSQFVYDQGLKSNFIKALTTPYGTSTFTYGDASTDSSLDSRTRWLEMTDPLGATERLEFTESVVPPDATDRYSGHTFYSQSPSVPTNLVPQGDIHTRDFVMEARNTFYWSKKAMMEMPQGTLDYSKAHIYHWLHYNDFSLSGAILESEKAPLENRVWYDYQGQSYEFPAPSLYDQGATTTGSSADSPATGTNLRTRVGRVLGDLNAGGTNQISKYDYNAAGKITRLVDPLGRTTTYHYDANGIDLLTVYQENPAGASTDDFGMAADKLASYTYNSLHEPLTVTDAAGQTTTNTYNTQGQMLTRAVMRSGSNETTTWSYDSNGYLQGITGPLTSATTGFTYDAFGRVQTQTTADKPGSPGYTLTYEYDALNRITKVTYPDGTNEQTLYNRLDVEWQRDRLGRWTHSFHDGLRRLAGVVDPLGRATQYDWCACGALEGIVDPKGNRTGFSYDVQSRLTQKQYPDNTAISYAYEATTSRLKSATDAKSQVTNYAYNIDNTLAGTTYTGTNGAALSPPTPAVSYAYDPVYSRISSMSDGAGVSTYGYYPVLSGSLGAGKLQSLAHSPAVGQLADYTFTYNYDELGRVKGRSLDSGNTLSTVFDPLGRATSITNALGTFGYSYVGGTGRLDHVDYPNAQTTQYSYFDLPADPRLQTINNLNAGGSTIISKFDYGYNAAGEITSWSQQRGNNAATANVHSFDYDAASQLQGDSVTLGGTGGSLSHQYAYRYDPSGNRTSEQIDANVNQASHNNLNQLLSRSGGGQMAFEGNLNEPGTVTLSGSAAPVDANNHFKGSAAVTTGSNSIPIVATDSNGNVTSKTISVTVSDSASQSFSYDLNGNMTADGSAGGSTYEWDPANRLVAINYAGTQKRTEFLYDGLSRRVRISEKNNGSVTSTKNLVWDGTQIAEERDGSNNVTKRYFAQGCLNGTDKQYYTRDHLGSVRDITNDAHAAEGSFDYDPWGRISLVGSTTNYPDFGFTGHYFHSPSRLHLALYRGYSAEAGRWVSRDPLWNAEKKEGPNLYEYVENGPTYAIDLLGLTSPCKDKCPPSPPKGDSHWTSDTNDKSVVGTIRRNITHRGEDCYMENVATDARHCCYDKNRTPTDNSMQENHNPYYPGQFWPHVGEAAGYYSDKYGPPPLMTPIYIPDLH